MSTPYAARSTLIIVLTLASLFGCGREAAPDDGGPVLSAVAQALGGNTQVDMSSTDTEQSPVGAIRAGGDIYCSGTLVARDKVLTAAHCYCQGKLTAPWTSNEFVLPAGQGGGFVTTFVDINVHPKFACSDQTRDSLDLAVATLAQEVPATVVERLPRLFLGPMKEALDTGKLTSKGSVVGWGYVTGSTGKGTRRFGPEKPTLWLGWGGISIWHSPSDSLLAEVHGGDSGGALYVLDWANQWVLVGVTHGFAPQRWAAAGDVGPTAGNHAFLMQALGGDPDADGWPTAVDNCPAVSNPDQTDEDHDEVGDALGCDNCRPDVCDAIAPGTPKIHCKNPDQSDKDSDGRGDTCDLCPSQGPSVADDDHDGVGDTCDFCPLPNENPSCTTTADCGALNAGFCIPGDGGGVPARCSEPADPDDDQIPTACDSCAFANTSSVNSNDSAEKREKVGVPLLVSRADDCDATPVVRLPPQKPELMSVALETTDGVGPDNVVTIHGERWLGKNENGSSPAPVDERVLYRHCNCIDVASPGSPELPLEQCVAQGGICSWDAPESANSQEWRTPTVNTTTGFPLPAAETPLALPFAVGAAPLLDVVWQWRSDLSSGKVSGSASPCTLDPFSCRTHGAFFTTTLGPVASARDASADLRDVFQLVKTPAVTIKPQIPIIIPNCGKVDCLRWLNPKLYLDDPAQLDFTDGIIAPGVLGVSPASPAGLVVSPTTAFDLSSDVSAGVAALIGDAGQLWLSPVEPPAQIRAATARRGVQAVGFPIDYSPSAQISPVLTTTSGLTGGSRVGPAALAVEVSEPSAPRARSGQLALYSGLEDAVYMIGGRAADGDPTGTIWRYVVGARSWQIVAPHAAHQPAQEMLAAAYDQAAGLLYVLDVDTEAAKPPRARLIRYDVRDGSSAQLASWPYSGLHDRLWLVAQADGSLVLIARLPKAYTAWRLRPKANGLTFEGMHAAPGRVLGQPVLGEDTPVLAVEWKGELVYRALASGQFNGHSPCSL